LPPKRLLSMENRKEGTLVILAMMKGVER